MKDRSIRFRVSDADRTKIEDFAHRTGRTMSEILRMAVADTMRGDVPGKDARRTWADVRRHSNALMHVIDTRPINILHLRAACINLRNAAQQLVQ
jgi:hypothetical protein